MRPLPPLILVLMLSTTVHASAPCLTPGIDCKKDPVVDAINVVVQLAAYGAAFKDQALMKQLEQAARTKLGASGNKTPTEAQVWKEMRGATERAVSGVVLPPESSTNRDTVSGHTTDDCKITFTVTQVDASGKETQSEFSAFDESARHSPNTCTEFIDAAYEHEKLHNKRCLDMMFGRTKQTAQSRAAEDAEAYRVQLHYLLDALEAANPACTPTEKQVKKAKDSFRQSLQKEMKAMSAAAGKGGHK